MSDLMGEFSRDVPGSLLKAQIERGVRLVRVETERWLRMAVERGAGWHVWRSDPRASSFGFVTAYDFRLVRDGDELAGPGIIFKQPELTDGERIRILDGRYDWQEDRWEDHCGVPGCGHSCCERWRA